MNNFLPIFTNILTFEETIKNKHIMEKISNSILTVEISEHGAELQSIKKNGKEYLWQGDA